MSLSQPRAVSAPAEPPVDTRPYLIERVDDAAVVQLYADGFAELPLRDKTLIWHLYLAAIVGRDIYYDQRYAHNLGMRDILEAVIRHAEGIDPATLREICRYTKLFWINTGPYNNITARKFVLNLTPGALLEAVTRAAANGARLPLKPGETLPQLVERFSPMFFDLSFDPLVTNKTPGPGRDILQMSANNLYVDVTMADLASFTERYGLNSRLVKREDGLVEEVYRMGGRYSETIARIVSHLEDALPYATESMAEALRALIRFYETGESVD